MTAPTRYRVKGKGRDRDVYDGARLVGHIYSDGVAWHGRRPDGEFVKDATGAIVRSTTIARWRSPYLWRNP